MYMNIAAYTCCFFNIFVCVLFPGKEGKSDTRWKKCSHRRKSRKKEIETVYVWFPTLGVNVIKVNEIIFFVSYMMTGIQYWKWIIIIIISYYYYYSIILHLQQNALENSGLY